MFRLVAHPHKNCDQAASADAASDECSSADGPLVVAGPAVVPLVSAPPGVAFIDGSVKPLVNDRTRSVTWCSSDPMRSRTFGRSGFVDATCNGPRGSPRSSGDHRTELSDPEREASTHATIAVFTRKVADLFKADNPTFSNEWFFGACGLDNWGELLPRPGP